MKTRFIFLFGRPGCGKSFVFNLFKKHMSDLISADIECERIDDFPVLKELLDADTECQRHVRKEGGFEITDFTLLDDVLSGIDARAREKSTDTRLIFIEFARSDYRSALEKFSQYVKDHCLAFYIYCSFDVCLKRNYARFAAQKDNAVDDHIVPADLMHAYYKTDDFENLYEESLDTLKAACPVPVAVIDTNDRPNDLVEKDIIQTVRQLT